MSRSQWGRRAGEAVAFLLVAVLAGMAASGGCAKSELKPDEKALAERQRDSILSNSGIPGAGVVGKAMDAADSAAVRAEEMDHTDHTGHGH